MGKAKTHAKVPNHQKGAPRGKFISHKHHGEHHHHHHGDHDYKYLIFVFGIALFVGYLHNQHIGSMFENQRFFSHLSTLERELSFRTEMGLYYSYYKTIAEAPSFVNGLYQIIQCNITEYPDNVNVLRRFNLYPEVVLGAFYRIYHSFANIFEMETKKCYSINRGQGLSPVQSCVGMGDIAHFYVYPIFWMNGLMISCFFLLGTYISGNILGGVLATASYFYNHGEATRVMWTPPLRESFSFPFLIAQMLTVVHLLKCQKPSMKHSLFLAGVTTCFMLPWQFAQFALLTQVCALFGLYVLKFIDSRRMMVLMQGLLLAHILNFIAQFANTLLISSFFMAAMIATIIIVKMEGILEKLPHRILIWISQAFLFLLLSVGIKVGTAKLFQIKDDAHIFDILKSKFSDYKDFHTLLYVCAPEFDFIGMEFPEKLTKTVVIPCAALVTIVLLFKILYNEWRYWIKGEDLNEEYQQCITKPFAVHFYLLLQTIAFVIMSILIMRLKLFGTPALCLLASMVASRDIFGFIGKKTHHYSAVFIILGLMSINGFSNLKTQFATKGEYNNPALENTIEWINANTKTTDVFAGSMPTMAAIKLSCGRPIVNHPHYEDSGLRARTKRVYQVYSRKPCSFVHKELKEMGVTHLVLEDSWCTRRTRQGCGLPEVWDIEDPTNKNKEPCCSLLRNNAAPFREVYGNDVYKILQV
ncbi:probable C-mannosyltransferase DPY19L1 [Hydractinia symbiolongicarpus]|uniref:probable C-mannosyltransferase DPY19L1 n=1 Tax=Hydractinia symbiolongicarpus TaxID=13093 RepID=UPI00254A1091|nr:probable C-mannosyltransferase DPY19L1 [Hydractinia symbiolongicarpus]